jgi:hypothetical protein
VPRLAHRDAERVGVPVDEDLDRVVGLAVAVTNRVRYQLADEQACRGGHVVGDDPARAVCAVSASFRRGLQIGLELDLGTPYRLRKKLVVERRARVDGRETD